MRLPRVRTRSGLETQQCDAGHWQPLRGKNPLGPSPFSAEWELATADRHLQLTGSLLPFAPLSFRDFLLSEQHNINASRGMLKRFYPGTYRLTTAFEKVTRRTYPGFKPKKLFYAEPIYYFGNAMTFVPTGTPVAFPSYSKGLDFELELAWVLNSPLYNATADEAIDAIGGFVLLNDFSARDVQHGTNPAVAGPNTGLAKAFDGFKPLGPALLTADDIAAMGNPQMAHSRRLGTPPHRRTWTAAP